MLGTCSLLTLIHLLTLNIHSLAKLNTAFKSQGNLTLFNDPISLRNSKAHQSHKTTSAMNVIRQYMYVWTYIAVAAMYPLLTLDSVLLQTQWTPCMTVWQSFWEFLFAALTFHAQCPQLVFHLRCCSAAPYFKQCLTLQNLTTEQVHIETKSDSWWVNPQSIKAFNLK